MKSFFNAIGNLFKKPVTTQFPVQQTYIPDDYRGLIVFEESLCIWCRKCEMACPPGAIVFSQDVETGKQEYHYSPYVCIYCKECVRACPAPGALLQSAEPGHPGLKEQNVNNGWNQLFDESLESRSAYAAEKKRKQAEEKAAADNAKAEAAVKSAEMAKENPDPEKNL